MSSTPSTTLLREGGAPFEEACRMGRRLRPKEMMSKKWKVSRDRVASTVWKT
jgi:hypothetical protein